MASYVFTDKAEHDLEKIIDFTVEHWGALQAIQYIDGLEEIAQTLADNPDIGLKRDAMLEGLLSFPYQRHILYYIKDFHGVSIIRVLHASMDSRKHMK
ncbi:MAG: type II toxin-antitoxin system RelE/ParE family toxin [Gammaproteobacteria bacterium]|nr:type II toxin-antitoxin system RelE/ParE family toxin [Gammaproteobacteria bacterium]